MIEATTLYIYGSLSILGGLVAAVGNLVALYIIWMPGHRSKSNKILTSLAVSDALTGLVVFPLNAYQSLTKAARFECAVDAVRAYCALLMAGSSVLTLVVIALDRYILMTKLASYDSILTKRRITIILVTCWVFPGLTPLLKLAGTLPYLTSMVLIFYGPIILLVIFYCLLIRVIYASRQKVIAHSMQQTKFLATPTCCETSTTTSECAATSNRTSNNNKVINTTTTTTTTSTTTKTLTTTKVKRSEKRHLKLAKSVAILLGCYLLCLMPFNLWLVLDIANSQDKFMDPYALQHLYLFGVFAGATNSCINPFIYLSKQPGFQKRFRQAVRKVTLAEGGS